MRILFVSGSTGGGSTRSTDELAGRLEGRGHRVGVLGARRDAAKRRYLHKRAVDATVRFRGTPLAGALRAAGAQIGRRPCALPSDDRVRRWSAVLPENALRDVLRRFAPDVVVVSSVGRTAWRDIRAQLRERGVPSVLYMREESALGQLADPGAAPDLLLANAASQADRAAALGHVARPIPSVVELDRVVVESSRERVLFVNPVDISGVAVAIELARARPDVPFTFAESWLLGRDARRALLARLAPLANVVFQPRVADPRDLYATARVLLAPYLTNGRPRVVLEAQVNGIPVLASDLPALREAVGPGGVLVAPDAPVREWVRALSAIVDDDARYEELSRAAAAHARRAEVDPGVVVERFEQALAGLLAGHRPAGAAGHGPGRGDA